MEIKEESTMTELDRIDRAILAELQRDGRLPVAKLADRVGLSETPCARRLKRLESEGYIDGYRAVLSRKTLGLGVVAFAQVRFSVHDRALSDRFEREIQGIARIVSCHNISGTADFLLQIVARDLDEYGIFMRDVLRTLPGVTAVESMLSLREVKRDGGLPLP
jgi:Lrp/AsnC family transcriptional regulator, leucine-responsive regulatory protein